VKPCGLLFDWVQSRQLAQLDSLPHFTLQFQAAGPQLELFVAVSQPRQQALQQMRPSPMAEDLCKVGEQPRQTGQGFTPAVMKLASGSNPYWLPSETHFHPKSLQDREMSPAPHT